MSIGGFVRNSEVTVTCPPFFFHQQQLNGYFVSKAWVWFWGSVLWEPGLTRFQEKGFENQVLGTGSGNQGALGSRIGREGFCSGSVNHLSLL